MISKDNREGLVPRKLAASVVLSPRVDNDTIEKVVFISIRPSSARF